ncbi:MAG: DUF2780 domain-containing protein [Desulfobacterales bacterium]|jgi:hypothetical protein
MIRGQFFNKILLTLLSICWMAYTPIYAGDLGLVDLISSQLGVSKNQAQGGAGSIFQLVKQNLSVEDFSSIAKAVPGIDQMIGAAPKIEESSSALGGISSMMGKTSNKLGGMAGLTSSFEKLGLSGDMVNKFTPIILDYVKNKGGEHAMNLLKGALL